MSDRHEIAASPLRATATLRHPAEAHPRLTEVRPAPVGAAASIPPPFTPPAPQAGFEALMQFTLMLEDELAEVERRSLAHSEQFRPPFPATLPAHTKP